MLRWSSDENDRARLGDRERLSQLVELREVSIVMAHQDRAPMKAAAAMIHEYVGARLVERTRAFADTGPTPLETIAKLARGIDWTAEGIGFAVWDLLESKAARAVKLRRAMREALALTEPYDEVVPAIRELAVALRRRQVYFIVRKAAVVLEAEGAVDVAAQLLDAAAAYEPNPDVDHLAFSPRRRLKSERRR